MQADRYRRYLETLDIASSTRSVRLSGARAVERHEDLDLDEEFARDRLKALISRFVYSTSDAREKRPNPTNITITPEKLYKYLAWYKAQIVAYHRFLESGVEVDEAEEAPDDMELQFTVPSEARQFSLERDLQAALRASISELEAGLEIVDGGVEASVEAGRIDILAKDVHSRWTVVELKAGVARPDAVAQILAYMGCIAETRGGDVRGLLVAADFDPRVAFAARAVPNLELRRYRYRFSFE